MLSVSLLGLFVENLLLFCTLIKIQLEVYGNGKDKNIESSIPTFPAITPGDKKKKSYHSPHWNFALKAKDKDSYIQKETQRRSNIYQKYQ